MWRTDPRVQNPIESSSHTSPVVLVKRLVADGSITAGAISVLNDSVRPTCPAIQSILRLRAFRVRKNRGTVGLNRGSPPYSARSDQSGPLVRERVFWLAKKFIGFLQPTDRQEN